MFKRIEKRRRKKEEEEELGIDEEMKDVLGMQDTDSDESDEDEDSDEEERHMDREENLMDDGEGALDDIQEDEGEEEEEENPDELPFITVQEALRDPLYVVSLQPEVKSCVVCPGKVLKGVSMYDVHRTSKARIFTQILGSTAANMLLYRLIHDDSRFSKNPLRNWTTKLVTHGTIFQRRKRRTIQEP